MRRAFVRESLSFRRTSTSWVCSSAVIFFWEELGVLSSDLSSSSVCSKDVTAFSFDDVQSLMVLSTVRLMKLVRSPAAHSSCCRTRSRPSRSSCSRSASRRWAASSFASRAWTVR